MNPSNPFGNPQIGALQAPSNTVKPGLFQSFGQPNSGTQPQTMGFYQPSAFGQPSPHGNTIFGQTPAFGQSSTQPSSVPAASQAPAFGQPSVGMSSSGFGGTTAPAFGQTSGLNQSSVFGQTPAFGQPSAFGQAPGFNKQPLGFGQPLSGFGNSQMASSSTPALGQPQPPGFGQSVFGHPPSTSDTTNVFVTAQSATQNRGFATTNFSFKPANEAVFKPIFSASPEPSNPQTTSMSNSPFGSSESQTSSSTMSSNIVTTTGFSSLTGAKSGPLGFSFSPPAVAPSISAQNTLLTTANSTGPSNTLQFTFSQPAAPSSSSTQVSTAEPTTPSSFSFSVNPSQPKVTPLFGGSGFRQPSAFGESKTKVESSADDKRSNLEDTNVFARLSKGTKRKEDPVVSSAGPVKPATEVDVSTEADAPRQPSKRPLMRSRGPLGGLFGRALSDLRRDGPKPGFREATKDSQQQMSTWEETEEVQGRSDDLTATPSTAQAQTRDVTEKAELCEEFGKTHRSYSPHYVHVGPRCE